MQGMAEGVATLWLVDAALWEWRILNLLDLV